MVCRGVSYVWVAPGAVCACCGRGASREAKLPSGGTSGLKTAQDFKARSGAAPSCNRRWAVSWVQQTRARLKGRPLPNPHPRPPWPFLPSARSPASHCQPQLGGLKRAALRGTGVLGAPGPQGGWEGARRCVGRGRAGPAPAARLSVPPIGPESYDSRAEQEGNRSRARRPRLQAVQLLPPLPRLPVGPSAHPQHERPARLQHVGHRLPRSECAPWGRALVVVLLLWTRRLGPAPRAGAARCWTRPPELGGGRLLGPILNTSFGHPGSSAHPLPG